MKTKGKGMCIIKK